MSHIVLGWFNSGYTVIVMRRRPLALWLSRQARAFAYLESATLFLEPLVSGRNVVRSPSAEKHGRIVLTMEALECPNTQVQAEHLMAVSGHLFEDIMATFHPPGITGEVACKSSKTQWAFRQLWKKYGVELHQLDLGSVFPTVGDPDTLWHPQFLGVITFWSQRSTNDGPTMDPSDGPRHCDARIGEPRDPILRFSSRRLLV